MVDTGWDSLNAGPSQQEQTEEQKQAEQQQQQIDRCVNRIMSEEANGPLKSYLRNIALSRSFKPGRTEADTAWSEGYRALAVELLTRGNATDG